MSRISKVWVIVVDDGYLHYPLPPSVTRVREDAFFYGSEGSAQTAITSLREIYGFQLRDWKMTVQVQLIELPEDECV